jgi:hypothetical protein
MIAMTPAQTLALTALAAALLAGCGSNGEDAPKEPPLSVPAPMTSTPAAAGGTAAESKIVSLPFRVDVSFSDGAREMMRETNADLGVSADYYGAPKDPRAPGLDPDLGVWLGGEMLTIDPGQKSLTFKGQVDAARVAREVAGDARVKVMAFPVRAYTAEAAITCTEADEYLSIAVETGATVHCTLKSE